MQNGAFLKSLSILIHLLLLQSGNVHPHPGPSSASSDTANISTLSSTLSSLHSLGLSRHLSFVHYNVQSIVPKLDTIMAELSDFDILAFSETWLNPSVTKDDISLLSYHPPERKIVLQIVMVVLLFILKIIYITLGVQILNPLELNVCG